MVVSCLVSSSLFSNSARVSCIFSSSSLVGSINEGSENRFDRGLSKAGGGANLVAAGVCGLVSSAVFFLFFFFFFMGGSGDLCGFVVVRVLGTSSL